MFNDLKLMNMSKEFNEIMTDLERKTLKDCELNNIPMTLEQLREDNKRNSLEAERKRRNIEEVQQTEYGKQKALYEERLSKNWCLQVTGNFIMFKPYERSPYLAPEVGNSGIILVRDKVYNPKSGTTEDMEDMRFIGTGLVLEVGPDVKNIKPGMEIMYIKGGERSLPVTTDEGDDTWYIIQGGNVVVYGFKKEK